MQQVAKRITHRKAREYRDIADDTVMYRHQNGGVYVIPSTAEAEYYAIEDRHFYVTHEPDTLVFGSGVHEARLVLLKQRTRLVDAP